MSQPYDPHSYFATPLWPRAAFLGNRPKKHAQSSSSCSSSNSDGAEHSSSESESPLSLEELNPHPRLDRLHKRETAILSSHQLTALPREYPGLRKKHFAVLTTVLYKCLLEHDWARAKRAFGLLIRGQDIDIRCIWGVGLDILLRVGEKENGEVDARSAIEYLERLVLFFPYRARLHSHHPWLVNPSDREEEEEEVKETGKKKRKTGKAGEGKRKKGKEKKKKKKEWMPPYTSAVEFNPHLFSLLIEFSKEVDPERIPEGGDYGSYAASEDTSPEKIKARLEELTLTPPWDSMAVLQLLKGMVCLWLVDVEKQRAVARARRQQDEDEESDGETNEKVELDEETKQRIEEVRAEAKEIFMGIRGKGEKLPDGIEWWLTHYDDVEDEDDYNDVEMEG
ncbi:hypothetical protein EX30DRAFT_392431 [Ascodesmis nigricans]|uniref:Uncharacterized protein n=1 Tax=Ascodesmis nigricans TaxID=341454 RepID=A0A4S2N7D1_9PEZI|nr:hypothetical protein EX30DRAFT_392431 [Ascodesmis nigricans]